MQIFARLLRLYDRLGEVSMSVRAWSWFVKAFATAFLTYWVHLHAGLDNWLGSGGFHLPSLAWPIFAPLPPPYPHLLWWATFAGGVLLYFERTVSWGCLLAGGGFFYATMCDLASIGALNMHFLYAFAVIFWSTGLRAAPAVLMSAWPAFLIRIYLIVVYFGSGWRKAIYGNWLDRPDVLFHSMSGYYVTNLLRLLDPIIPMFIWNLMQFVTIGFELGAPLLLLHPSFRRFGVIMGCSLHLGIAFLMKGLIYFSFQMMVFYIPVLMRTKPHSEINGTEHRLLFNRRV